MVSIDDFITQRARQFSLENQRSGPMSGTVQSVDVFVIQAGNQLAKRLFKRVGLKQQTIGVAGCRKSINSAHATRRQTTQQFAQTGALTANQFNITGADLT